MNSNKLYGKIAESRITQQELAEKIGMDSSTLWRKLSGKSEFTRNEIQSIINILKLSAEEVNSIFFSE